MENLTKLCRSDLERRLNTKEEDLEEIVEERNYVLRQTGLHLSGGTVKKYEAQIESLQQSIDELRKKLADTNIE